MWSIPIHFKRCKSVSACLRLKKKINGMRRGEMVPERKIGVCHEIPVQHWLLHQGTIWCILSFPPIPTETQFSHSLLQTLEQTSKSQRGFSRYAVCNIGNIYFEQGDWWAWWIITEHTMLKQHIWWLLCYQVFVYCLVPYIVIVYCICSNMNIFMFFTCGSAYVLYTKVTSF